MDQINKNSCNRSKSKKKPAAAAAAGHRRTLLICKKHPKHRQSPGVCSICLGERLSKLHPSASSSRAAAITNIASSANYSSSSDLSSLSSPISSQCSSNASSCPSPRYRNNYTSTGFDGKGFLLSLFLKSGKNNNTNNFISNIGRAGDQEPGRQRKTIVFTKSRSMAFLEEQQGDDQHGIIMMAKKKKKKGGFWSKLIRSTSNSNANKRTSTGNHDQGGPAAAGLMHSRTMNDMVITKSLLI